jgi:UDP-N-acetylmuramoyl-L-alanyl-D-glutamate--2,6-diaminopimelate ligase
MDCIGQTIGDLALSDPNLRLIGDPAVTILDVVYDSREVRPGCLFAALPGADFDGHDFAAQAVERGAAALLVQQPLEVAVPQLVSEDSRRALAGVAARIFDYPSERLGVIGVTGTDGKTTSSYLAEAVLRRAGRRTGMIGTIALRIGDQVDHHAARQTTPESADTQRLLRRMVDAGVEWAVLEATSHGLDLHRLDHVRFRVGAVTNVTHEHLEHHKTIAAYRRAKAILFERTSSAGGVSVVNLDDEGAREMLAYAGDGPLIRYSARGDRDADLRAEEIALGPEGSRLVLVWRDQREPVQLPLIGGFNVANALCAAGIGLACGLSFQDVAAGLADAPQVPGRMTRVEMGQPFGVVVDYAHTPAALETILCLLRGLYPTGRLIAVFGSAGERDVAKRPMQGSVSARWADISVVTSEDPRNEPAEQIVAEIVAGARAAGARPEENLFAVVDRREAVQLALSLARSGDCVLLAGKGHEQSIIWGREKRPWDEETVAREELAALGWIAAGSDERRWRLQGARGAQAS